MDLVEQDGMDAGTGYGRQPSTYLSELTEVGPGTPMGELLRRYWHPVGLAAERPHAARCVCWARTSSCFATTGAPRAAARPLAHRGTSLYYGKVDDEGIRCCYHGWQYDVEGRCLDQPCEPAGGRARYASASRGTVEERYGLISPIWVRRQSGRCFPRYRTLEQLADQRARGCRGGAGAGFRPADLSVQLAAEVTKTSWTRSMRRSCMPGFSANQFNRPEFAQLPKVKWEYTDLGVSCSTDRVMPGGMILRRIMEAAVPNIQIIMPPHEPPARSAGSPGPCRSMTRICAILLPLASTKGITCRSSGSTAFIPGRS